MSAYKWSFYCTDNGGKAQRFEINAVSKTEAINKGFAKAKKHSKGDIISWNCCLKATF